MTKPPFDVWTANVVKLSDLTDLEPSDLPLDRLEEALSMLSRAQFVADRDRSDRGLLNRTKIRCDRCGKKEIAEVEFYDYTSGGGRPRNRWRLAARLVCNGSGVNHGEAGVGTYWIPFGSGRDDERPWLDDWCAHLAKMRWWDPSFREDLAHADRLWQMQEAKRALTSLYAGSAGKRRLQAAGRNPRSIGNRVRAAVMQRDGFKCRRCGCGPDIRRLEVDHILPVARGGTSDLVNLQTLCVRCNAGKTDSEPHSHDKRGR